MQPEMDFKKTKWIEEKRKNWPEGSLERQLLLNYPGCKTLFEAVQKAKNSKQDLTAAQSMDEYQEMKKIISEVEELTSKIDLNLIPEDVRKSLAQMPLTDLNRAKDWKEAWAKVLGGANEAGGRISDPGTIKDDEQFSW